MKLLSRYDQDLSVKTIYGSAEIFTQSPSPFNIATKSCEFSNIKNAFLREAATSPTCDIFLRHMRSANYTLLQQVSVNILQTDYCIYGKESTHRLL